MNSNTRPELPGSTNHGMIRVYSSSLPANIRDGKPKKISRPVSSSAYQSQSLSSQLEFGLPEIDNALKETRLTEQSSNESKERYTHKLLQQLPYNIRENVLALINTTTSKANKLEREIELKNVENVKLRQELAKRVIDTENAQKLSEIYRERLRSAEDKIAIQAESIENSQRIVIQNRRVMDRMTATNRTLVDALDALHITNDGPIQTSGFQTVQSPHEYDAPNSPTKKNNGRSPKYSDVPNVVLQSPRRLVVSGIVTTGLINNSKSGGMIDSKLAQKKLRESLLRVVRVHYQSMKNTDVLEAKLEETKAKLKAYEIEINEYKRRSEADVSSQYKDEPGSIPKRASSYISVDAKPTINPQQPFPQRKKYYFGDTDERFLGLLGLNHFDVSDTVIQLRRVVAFMTEVSSKILTIEEICCLCTSSTVAKILDVEFISLFMRPILAHSGAEFGQENTSESNILYKYTCRSRKPDLVDNKNTQSLAQQILKVKKNARLNSLSRVTSYNPAIDSTPGINAKRILSIPLRDLHGQPIEGNATSMLSIMENENSSEAQIFGTIHFINKSSVFSESDEIIFSTFTDFIASMLLNAKYINDVFEKSQLFGHLLESSTAVYDVIPDHHNSSFEPSRLSIQPGQILNTIEKICYNVLKVSKVRALLVNKSNNSEGCEFAYLDPYSRNSSSRLDDAIANAAIHCGIAGHVYRTKDFHVVDYLTPNDHDDKLNPTVDLEPFLGGYMLALPVISLNGNIIAVIELIHGISSPAIRRRSNTVAYQSSYDRDYVDFEQAALWLIHQLTPPLEYLLSNVGKHISKPLKSPSNVSPKVPQSPRLPFTTASPFHSPNRRSPPALGSFVKSPSFNNLKSNGLVSQRRVSKQELGGQLIRDNSDSRNPSFNQLDMDGAGQSGFFRNIDPLVESLSQCEDVSLAESLKKPQENIPLPLDISLGHMEGSILQSSTVSKDEYNRILDECEYLKKQNQILLSQIEGLKTGVVDASYVEPDTRDYTGVNDRENDCVLPDEPAPIIARPVRLMPS